MSEYRGCWNCLHHNDGDGYVLCDIGKNLNTVFLRCPGWIPRNEKEEEENDNDRNY